MRGNGAPLDWAVLASAAMGIATAETLQRGLLQSLPRDTPVAIVQHASLPRQRQALCRLHELAMTVAAQKLGSPAIIVVGDVARAALAMSEDSGRSIRAC